MAEEVLEQEKRPSQDGTFAANVLARVLREFHEQEAKDLHTVDRGLLENGRTALFQVLATDAPLDASTVRDGFTLLDRKLDWQGQSALLMRYLAQSPPDSETAWAYLQLANTIAVSGNAAGAVLAHEAFERWLPGRSPRLSARWPYYPADDETTDPVLAGDEVRLLFLGQSAEFTTSYLGVWRNNDYLSKADAALGEIPITGSNRRKHFSVLRMASNACEISGNYDRAHGYIRQMHALAEGAEEESQRAEIEAKALGHDAGLARNRGDEGAFNTAIAAMAALLNAAEAQEFSRDGWIRGERHDLACGLVRWNRHEQALPLWEANAASGGQIGGWGWLLYAATVWQLSHDRDKTLTLLREAAVHDDREMLPFFTERSEFADVRADPKFLQAIRRK